MAALLALAGTASAATSSDFTYQGQLENSGAPASGSYDFQFTLYDAASAGNVVGSPNVVSAVTVTNGLFAVQLDFGLMAFSGGDRYLEIQVRSAGSGSYTTLAPLQKVSAAPVALTAINNVNRSGDTMTGTLNLPTDGLAVGTSELVTSNGNVGIGTATPQTTLDIHGSQQSAFISLNDGNASGDAYTVGSYQGVFYLGHNTPSSGATLIYYSPQGATLNMEAPVNMAYGEQVAVWPASGSFTLGAYQRVVLADSTNAALTLTLPAPVQGALMTIKHATGSNTVTLSGGGHTIDGAASITLSLTATRTVVSDGSNWFIIGN